MNSEGTVENKLPQGEGKALNRYAEERWSEHLFQLSPVANKVLVVNSAFKDTAPFNLREGKHSAFGLFADRSFKTQPKTLRRGITGEYSKGHNRSALLGRLIFSDNEGNVYRDLDIKGMGYLKTTPEGKIAVGNPGGIWYRYRPNERIGFLEKESAFYDMDMTERFLNAGIRTNRVVAIVSLKKAIYHNMLKGITDKFKRLRIIGMGKKFEPVLEVRAFRTKARVRDYIDAPHSRQELLLADAKRIVSEELGRLNAFSDKEYLEWFAQTLGRNVALMHRSRWIHKYLRLGHNITLDCRIIDLDSVDNPTETEDFNKDYSDAKNMLVNFQRNVFKGDCLEEITELFERGYEAVFPLNKREGYFKQ